MPQMCQTGVSSPSSLNNPKLSTLSSTFHGAIAPYDTSLSPAKLRLHSQKNNEMGQRRYSLDDIENQLYYQQ